MKNPDEVDKEEIIKPSDNSYIYFAGDGARKDEEGYFWVMGRVDDVINVSGHRLGTMEIESALVSHQLVSEAAVVGRPDNLKGESIVAFVTLKTGAEDDETMPSVKVDRSKSRFAKSRSRRK